MKAEHCSEPRIEDKGNQNKPNPVCQSQIHPKDSLNLASPKLRTNCERQQRRKPCQLSIGQAPELITNALGPSIDVSIIENLKMMRNIFNCKCLFSKLPYMPKPFIKFILNNKTR